MGPIGMTRARGYAPLVLVAVAVVLGVLPGCSSGETSSTGRMKVAATIVPLADFCRQVGKDLVEVKTLIPPGASSHAYEPKASEFAFVSEARVFVMNGLDLEDWAADIIRKVGPRDMVVVETADAVPKRELVKAGEFSGEKEPGQTFDAHIWLDPALAIYQVEAIRDGFIEADPAHKAEYADNAAAYVKELQALDREIEAATATFNTKQFVALHPGWAYFSKRYGIIQAAAVQEFPEQEPSGKQIQDVINEIKAKDINVVFAEPQISARAADAIAASIPGLKVYFLDPLGDPKNPEVDTYIKTMRHNLQVMEEVLR